MSTSPKAHFKWVGIADAHPFLEIIDQSRQRNPNCPSSGRMTDPEVIPKCLRSLVLELIARGPVDWSK